MHSEDIVEGKLRGVMELLAKVKEGIRLINEARDMGKRMLNQSRQV
jgi:hypothetical protein